jgi:xanthine dehydrogenase accessory factor
MTEYRAILCGFDTLCGEGKSAALATVVHVAGSSYRRPGARLFAAADGRTWGGVSGGCLERDVIRRLRGLIDTGTRAVVRYDTTDEDNDFAAATGVALGCQGIIDIFLEPISAQSPGPIPALRRAVVDRQATAVATVIRSSSALVPAGSRFTPEGVPPTLPQLAADLQSLTASTLRHYDLSTNAGAGAIDVFRERLLPPQSLVLFGGGPDVLPVVTIAKTLGWHVTVIASHGSPDYRRRFAAADRVHAAADDDPLAGVSIEPDAAVVLMTHNYPRDLQLLPRVLAGAPRYLGILGPRRRAERLVLEAPSVPPDALGRIHAPVGLDLGAEMPESIALAIIAEIQAVLADRPRSSLKDRPGPIYARPGGDTAGAPYNPSACPMSA